MKNLLTILSLLVVLIFTACKDEEESNPMKNLNLNISGLEALGNDAIYEGWLIVDGVPVSSGTFNVDASGSMSQTSFSVNATDLNAASTFVLTIEPVPDTDAGPSDVHLLGGDFSANSAGLTVGHGAALGDDYSSSAGKYILATPTNGADTNEESGIWFLDPTTMPDPTAGLTLPTLPAGWKYEGWVVIDGQPVTSGKFTAINDFDEADPFSGSEPGPPFPGEDYLENQPSGLTFPTDIRGGTAVISIEPDPDNSVAPFTLKPLVGAIDADAVHHTPYELEQNLGSFPSGTATK